MGISQDSAATAPTAGARAAGRGAGRSPDPPDGCAETCGAGGGEIFHGIFNRILTGIKGMFNGYKHERSMETSQISWYFVVFLNVIFHGDSLGFNG